eukprot:Em0004g1395a
MDTHVRDGHVRDGHARQGWTRTSGMAVLKESRRSRRKCLISSTCQLCSEPYKEPRILPCLHSFCGHCLHKEVWDQAEHACQRSITIPEGGVNAIPQNLHLGFEVAFDANDKMAAQFDTSRENVTLTITKTFEQLHQTIEERKKTVYTVVRDGGHSLSETTDLTLQKEHTWLSESLVKVKAELKPKTRDGTVVPGKVEDHGDGTYTITLTLRLLVLTSSSSQWMVKMYRRVLVTLIVVLLDEAGTWLRTIDLNVRSFKNPYGLALDPEGNIHVVAYGSNTINVFTHCALKWDKLGMGTHVIMMSAPPPRGYGGRRAYHQHLIYYCSRSKEGFMLSAIITMATTSGTLLLVHLDIRR